LNIEHQTLTITDQTGRPLSFSVPAKRIVSLVPSQTELLYDLGLRDEVIGITTFCVHPDEWFRSKKRVGGTKNFKPEVIRGIHPDLILANKEENELSLLKDLMNEFPVWVSDIATLDAAMEMIQTVGQLTGKEKAASGIVQECNAAFARLDPERNEKSVLYLIWQKPWMCAGNDTFIHHMLTRCGWRNAVQAPRYPELSEEEIRKMNPDRILLSSEPFPFAEKHRTEMQQIFPESEILLVDGEFFSWYGSRLRFAPAYFASIIRN
jgi:ABC-type Fe3+-hydroxamate transport system substrate-binding protein